MMQKADFLKRRLEDTLFVMRIYEMYSKKAPTDKLAHYICAEYGKRYLLLAEEYARLCDDRGSVGG